MLNVALQTIEGRVRLVVGGPSPDDPAPTEPHAEFELEVCPSPVCHCREVGFVERVGDGSAAGRRPRQFSLDPIGRCPAEPDPSEAPESEQLALQIARELSAESWKLLATLFLAEKARAIAEIDCKSERVPFPFDDIERDGAMTPYREIIPYDREILVTDGTRRLVVDEQHCVQPDCDCSDVILSVQELEGTTDSVGVRAIDEVAALRVDHRRDRWVDADTDGPLGQEALELRRLLLAQHPQLLATLGRQQALLRELYLTAAASEGRPVLAPPTPIVAAPRIGRNDPCPCGSGKKHKKCCLRP